MKRSDIGQPFLRYQVLGLSVMGKMNRFKAIVLQLNERRTDGGMKGTNGKRG